MTEVRRAGVCAVVCLVLGWGAQPATAGKWRLAQGPSSVTFTVGHLILSEVSGRFSRFSGWVELSGDDFATATIEATVEVKSLYTGHRDRDQHLLSDEFFSEESFPEIRFRSRSVRAILEGTYEILGELTIRGVRREILLRAESLGERMTTSGRRTDFRAVGTINRSDFGLTWNHLWNDKALVGEEVELGLEIALIEVPDAAQKPRKDRASSPVPAESPASPNRD